MFYEKIKHKLNVETPHSQAAYRKNRSTTEHILATKLMIDRTLTAKNETIYIILLDMSKAFDNVNRRILMDDLQQTINADELHLVNTLLKVNLAVRCGNNMSQSFDTDIGTPQGDCASANKFTYFLAKSLQQNHYIKQHNIVQLSFPGAYTEHNYAIIPQTKHLNLDMQYADDICKASTDYNSIQRFKDETPKLLKKRDNNK